VRSTVEATKHRTLAVSALSKLQIPYRVVGPVTVDVVDGFVPGQRTTELPGHDETVLEDVAASISVTTISHGKERIFRTYPNMCVPI
jgi:hypothetical protein